MAIVAPMMLDTHGRATSVNARQWITAKLGLFENRTVILLPPDAGADAGPVPVPGCPLGAGSAECARGTPETVGETDWYSGTKGVPLPRIPATLPAAFGPDGEGVLLTPCCDAIARDVKPVPGPRFVGVTTLFPPDDPPRAVDRGVLWRSPGDVYELLPAGDFANGPLPTSADASFTIVGGGLDPLLPVAWLPTGASFELVVLPLLDGDIVGGASSIDDARIVGWSADSERSNAVLWVRKAGRFVPRALPVPDGSPSCRKAVGVSGHRIAGSCNGANGREIGVVWQSSADGVGWFVAALLAPVEGDVGAHVSGLSLDLAVGWSTATEGVVRPVVWRLP